MATNIKFINKKLEKVPTDHSFIFFDVESRFTHFPLDYTINIILRRIYGDNELYTNISKKEIKELLFLCTKNIHFTFNKIYQQCDGLVMGSPLGPVITGLFMVELEKSLIPTLMEHMSPWKQYVANTIAVIKFSSIEHVLSLLSSFHPNIEFTYELERNGKINFLDVMLIRRNDTLQTTIYRKSTHNRVYLHWNSYAPRAWKHGTLRKILIQAYKICSSNELLQNELIQTEEEFIKINGYPKWVFNQVNEECKVPRNVDYDKNVTANNENISTTHKLVLPYKGERGQKIINSVNNYIKRLLYTTKSYSTTHI